jgi:hypothetical protein
MSEAYYNRLRLNLLIQMLEYNPNNNSDLRVNTEEKIDTYESLNLESPFQHTAMLQKDDVDIEVIPATYTGIKFFYMRVLTQSLATAPVNGTVNVKITSSGGGADQLINADLLMRRSLNADITSIKLTNNEDDADGVELPVLIILGGIKS